jgi:Flp pilus assembly protein TadB
MSAAGSPDGRRRAATTGQQRPADIARLRARRRAWRRRRRLLRVDLGFGVAAALIILLVSPGLAITGLLSLVILVLCGLSIALGRRRRARARKPRSPAGRLDPPQTASARAGRAGPRRDRTRSTG